jgi:hypothetical protein
VAGGHDGLFYWDGTALAKLVLQGDASPAGGSFEAIGFAGQNDAGVWAFRATRSLDHGGGIYRADTAGGGPSIASVVLQGAAAPIGGTFRTFPTSLVPAVNAAGAIAFRATLEDAPFPSGVFVAAPEGTLSKRVAAGEPTAAGQLFRLREVALDDDGAVLVRAALAGGTPGLFRANAGRVSAFALLGDATDLGAGFRFGDPRARRRVDDGLFLGTREGLFVAGADGALRTVATLGQRTPLGGTWAGFEQPAAGPGGIVFGASVQGGRRRGLSRSAAAPRTVVRAGARVKGVGSILDLFS